MYGPRESGLRLKPKGYYSATAYSDVFDHHSITRTLQPEHPPEIRLAQLLSVSRSCPRACERIHLPSPASRSARCLAPRCRTRSGPSDGMQLSVSLHFFVHCEQILARLADEMSCLICPGLTAEWMTPRTLCCLPFVSHLH